MSISRFPVRRDNRTGLRVIPAARPGPKQTSITQGDRIMRVMVIVKASKESEAGVLPDTEILTKMGKYNEELVKAGVMLAGDGLHPTSKAKRVKFSGDKRT